MSSGLSNIRTIGTNTARDVGAATDAIAIQAVAEGQMLDQQLIDSVNKGFSEKRALIENDLFVSATMDPTLKILADGRSLLKVH
jgi:hypothetical protein